MFREHVYVIWGTYCSCGNECSILQNQHHPWVDKKFSVKMNCSSCGSKVLIDQNSAQDFYNKKIFSFFADLNGTVVDFGCGDGFLSRNLLSQNDIHKIYGVDIDLECLDQTKDITDTRFVFRKCDGCNLSSLFYPNSIDFLISRDVFMFVDNPDQYFSDVNMIVKNGIRQMGWYQKSDNRIKNRLEPQLIAEKYQNMGWHVKLQELDWYMSGYFLSADKV